VAGSFSGSGKIVFLQQRIQVLVDMYRRVILICMGRSIERQDGEDFQRCVSCHFQIGAASDTFTDRQRNGIYQPSISKVSQGTRRALLYHLQRGDQSQYR
jgi:hypothetical protein